MIRVIAASDAAPFLAARREFMSDAEDAVKPILAAVSERGDAAVREYAWRLDGFSGALIAPASELAESERTLEADLRKSLEVALKNIEDFARLQMPREFMVELAPGHKVGQVLRPLDKVGAYVPGGRYPMPSTVMMTCVPAKVAGVPKLFVACPRRDATTDAAAAMVEANAVIRVGGAHAVAAMAFGTESIPKVDIIVGPGNKFVAAAKKLLAGDVAIEFVAGPTEVCIVASSGEAAWIAADMLAQAEHDVDARSIFLTTSADLGQAVAQEIERQLVSLPTQETARAAIERNGAVVVCESVGQAADLANEMAPEHLCLHEPDLVGEIRNAGSIFLGSFSPEAAGDYVTGPNHVLPTSGAARVTGGLSVCHFLKVITVQDLDREALSAVASSASRLARAEGLEAHARSIEIRLEGER